MNIVEQRSLADIPKLSVVMFQDGVPEVQKGSYELLYQCIDDAYGKAIKYLSVGVVSSVKDFEARLALIDNVIDLSRSAFKNFVNPSFAHATMTRITENEEGSLLYDNFLMVDKGIDSLCVIAAGEHGWTQKIWRQINQHILDSVPML